MDAKVSPHEELVRLQAENEGLRRNLAELRLQLGVLHTELAKPHDRHPVTLRLWLRQSAKRWVQRLDGLLFGGNR
jgi:hypothetical protein